MVRKILDWEAQGQNLDGKVALVADNPDAAGDFEADLRDIETSFLSGRETTQIFLGQIGDRDVARSQILDAFNSGLSLISYVGHGGGAVWAGENMLNSSDPASLLAQPRQPFMLTMNCLNGYFITPFYESLAEGFLKAEGRGTIGAFSPSGLSLDGPAHLYHRALMQEIAGGQHERLGDAILAAQKTYAQTPAPSRSSSASTTCSVTRRMTHPLASSREREGGIGLSSPENHWVAGDGSRVSYEGGDTLLAQPWPVLRREASSSEFACPCGAIRGCHAAASYSRRRRTARGRAPFLAAPLPASGTLTLRGRPGADRATSASATTIPPPPHQRGPDRQLRMGTRHHNSSTIVCIQNSRANGGTPGATSTRSPRATRSTAPSTASGTCRGRGGGRRSTPVTPTT